MMQNSEGNQRLDCHAKTCYLESDFPFKWTLEKFSKIKRPKMLSSYFYPEIGCAWWVCLTEISSFWSLHLYRSGGHGDVKVKCKLGVTDGNGQVLRKNELSVSFDNKTTHMPLIGSMLICAEEIKDTGNDVLIITLELKLRKQRTILLETSVPSCSLSDDSYQKGILMSLSDDLRKIYGCHLNTDITISIDGESLAAHKAILSARSPVFANMLQQKMTESTNNDIVIDDIKMAVMKEVVAFMYGSAKREYDYATAVQIYYAADKYLIKQLREICGCILVTKLNMENAHQVLQLAERHHDQWLTKKVMKYITFHAIQENSESKEIDGIV